MATGWNHAAEAHLPLAAEFDLVQPLGKGTFGVTKLMRDRATGRLVCVKFLERGEDVHSGLLREVLNHRCLRHRHIVRFHRLILTPTHVAIVMEAARGGELLQRVRACPGRRLPEAEARYFFQQLVAVIGYVHARGICHRDLKLENLLLDDREPQPDVLCTAGPFAGADAADAAAGASNGLAARMGGLALAEPPASPGGLPLIPPAPPPSPSSPNVGPLAPFESLRLKLCDFGYSKDFVHSSNPKSVVGSVAYLAPELMSTAPYNGEQADVWSCGCVLYTALFGAHPFSDPKEPGNSMLAMMRLRRARYEPPPEVQVSAEALDLLAKIFVPDPSARISVAGMAAHPWVQRDLPAEHKCEYERIINRGVASSAAIGSNKSVDAAGPSPRTALRPPPDDAPGSPSHPNTSESDDSAHRAAPAEPAWPEQTASAVSDDDDDDGGPAGAGQPVGEIERLIREASTRPVPRQGSRTSDGGFSSFDFEFDRRSGESATASIEFGDAGEYA